ncbi:DUF6984 family protein [Sphingobacterium faecium]|uniref:DUF6984 family protein n=1 Tax=Sphingobacterium faecium TaxID=34087 RepID=UPI003DA68C13
MEYRKLDPREFLFIDQFLTGVNESQKYVLQLNSAFVRDLGVKYCLRFLLYEYNYEDIDVFGNNLIQKQILDNDNVPILISLDLDTKGNLFELDVWKADFSEITINLLDISI